MRDAIIYHTLSMIPSTRSANWLTGLLAAIACLSSFSCLAAPTAVPGWKVELVAQAPDIKHPSVVCAAPDGRVFVAEDPMDIREDTPAESKNGRIICLHPDGKRTVFAEKLHAVFGMQYLEGKLYVLHNPLFTVFRDDAGVGRDALSSVFAGGIPVQPIEGRYTILLLGGDAGVENQVQHHVAQFLFQVG